MRGATSVRGVGYGGGGYIRAEKYILQKNYAGRTCLAINTRGNTANTRTESGFSTLRKRKIMRIVEQESRVYAVCSVLVFAKPRVCLSTANTQPRLIVPRCYPVAACRRPS